MDVHDYGLQPKDLLGRDVRNIGRVPQALTKSLLLLLRAQEAIAHILILKIEVSLAQQVVDVLVQGVPVQLGEEGKTELLRDFGDLLDLGDSNLFLDGEGVEEVAAKDE